MDKISIVIPCYNEQDTIPYLKEELYKLMESMPQVAFEIVLVDNCSKDGTLNLMKQLHDGDPRFEYISFSRNFGKDSSMYAGLKASTGDYVTVMDADLQDPPELLAEMYETLKTGEYDCAAAFRKDRKGEPWLRSVLAGAFYRMMSRISDSDMVNGARDFRLMTRHMVDAVLELEESERFTKGIFSWVGFRIKWIPFENRERVAGKTKLPMKNAFSYAIKGIVAFSTAPLVAISVLGFIFCIIALVYTIVIVVKQLVLHEAVAGYPSIMCILLFGFGMIFLVLGIIGQYLAQMYLEIKRRPKYIVRETSVDHI
ncbi:MAG: glycosyltransferase family 2 protein [Lachnospiraceae bacterium]|nr:glycosyltransferase family 2 protein [Lachnospiraceae bacterium]MBQ8947870.1 glycosyltransferase family 2 protein [Lachnospiraceae bacterium]